MTQAFVGAVLACLLSISAPSAQANIDDLLRMSEQLDRLEQIEFLGLVNKANDCMRARDFKCADESLEKARKRAKSPADLTAWRQVNNDIIKEKQHVREEREERQRREKEAREAEEREEQRKWDLAKLCQRQCEDFAERRMCEDGQLNPYQCSSEDSGSSIDMSAVLFRQQLMQNAQDALALQNTYMQGVRMAQAQQEQERKARQDQERQEAQRRKEQETQRAAAQRTRDQQAAREQEQRDADARRLRQEAEARIAKQQAEARALLAKQEAEAKRAQLDALRKAKADAESLEKARSEADYLQRLVAGTRLQARNCYGEQRVGGQLAKLTPRVVECVDIHFKAYCQGGNVSGAYRGVLSNMVNNVGGCFGDNAPIDPPLGCDVGSIIVEAVSAKPCGG